MKKHTPLIVASVLSLLLCIGAVWRISAQKNKFDRIVVEALKTSEGYDQLFIDMVNRLEHELALRASFGYAGQKDPMTGKERFVVQQLPPVRRSTSGTAAASEMVVDLDMVKLTAIIFDDEKKVYTAIVMDDERSYAVDVGDKVAGRSVTKITNDRVFMEDAEHFYFYEITGKKGKRPRETQAEGLKALPPINSN